MLEKPTSMYVRDGPIAILSRLLRKHFLWRRLSVPFLARSSHDVVGRDDGALKACARREHPIALRCG